MLDGRRCRGAKKGDNMGFFTLKNKTTNESISPKQTSVFGEDIKNYTDFSVLEEKSYKSKSGLLPNEIYLLFNAEKILSDVQEYEITGIRFNPQPYLKKLMEGGFIEIGSLSDSLNLETTNNLKLILKNKGIDSPQKKSDIIKRILDQIDNTELDRNFPTKPFKLTEKGLQETKDNEYIQYILTKDWYLTTINIWSLNQIVFCNQNTSYKGALINYFIGQLDYFKAQHNWGSYSYFNFLIADVFIDSDEYEQALPYSISAVIVDLMGGVYYNPNNDLSIFEEDIWSDDGEGPGLHNKRSAQLQKIRIKVGLSEEVFKENIKQEFAKICYPITSYSFTDLIELITAIDNNEKDLIESVKEKGHKKFRTLYGLKLKGK